MEEPSVVLLRDQETGREDSILGEGPFDAIPIYPPHSFSRLHGLNLSAFILTSIKLTTRKRVVHHAHGNSRGGFSP